MKNQTFPSFPRIPTMANEGSVDCNEKNMEEIGGRTQGWENVWERARPSPILLVSQRKKYSRGIGAAWLPWKTQVGSCYNHKTRPEI